MRILFVDQFSEPGGAQIALLDLLEETARRGWLVEVMAPGNGRLHSACAKRGIPTSQLPFAHYANRHKTMGDVCRYSLDSMRAGLAIRAAARRFRPDLIYANGPRVLPAVVVGAGTTPILFHAHSCPDREYARRITQWCIRRKQMRVIAISRFVAQPFPDSGDATGFRIIYNGVRDHGFFPRPRAQPSYVGIIGRIAPEKGYLDFVRAAKLIVDSRPGLRFAVFGAALFSGDAYEREVRAAAEGVPVEFRGWTDDIPAALREIDILAVPSGPAEGATRVILEAFSAGIPVVAYPSGGIPELVTHGETGILTVGPGPDQLAHALDRLLDDSALMSRLSSHGRREWQDRFQLERFQCEVCEFIAETVTAPEFAAASGPRATSADRSASRAPQPSGGERRAAP